MTGFSLGGKRVWVAGHRGMVGSAIVRRLAGEDCQILTVDRSEVDLKNQAAVAAWMERAKPNAVFLAAAKVGGILANDTYPVDFLYDNLMIEANIIELSFRVGVEKLLFLGSSCIYPKFAEQPIVEESLLTGSLEPTNEWYAIAKIAGIKLAQAYRKQHGRDFISAMPTNLYGPGDNFDLASSHVLPALIRKAHEAKLRGDKSIVIWGTGTARREFLHVDDCADACVRLMNVYSDPVHVNVGSGEDLTISRTGTTRLRGRRIRGRNRPRSQQARRDTAKTHERGQNAGLGLEALDRAPRRLGPDLRMVPGQRAAALMDVFGCEGRFRLDPVRSWRGGRRCRPRRRRRCWTCRAGWATAHCHGGRRRWRPMCESSRGCGRRHVILVAKGGNNRIDALGRVLRRFRLTIELAPNAQVLSTRSAHWRREMLTLDVLARGR